MTFYGGWLATVPDGETFAHVAPVFDLREHVLEDTTCWCKPRMDGTVIVHNSMDGREAYEEGRKES